MLISVEVSRAGSSHTVHLEDLDVRDATSSGFGCAGLTTSCRLRLVVPGQRLDPDRR